MGCGTGRNLVLAARRHPEARFCGLDVSSAMLDTARGALDRSGLAGRVSLAQADATAFDPAALFGRPGFERVYVSYILSMIPDWRAALERAADAVAPGGRLLLVDFGRQEGLPGLFGRGLLAWLALFGVHPVAALPEAVADLAARRGWGRAVPEPAPRLRRLRRAGATAGRLTAGRPAEHRPGVAVVEHGPGAAIADLFGHADRPDVVGCDDAQRAAIAEVPVSPGEGALDRLGGVAEAGRRRGQHPADLGIPAERRHGGPTVVGEADVADIAPGPALLDGPVARTRASPNGPRSAGTGPRPPPRSPAGSR